MRVTLSKLVLLLSILVVPAFTVSAAQHMTEGAAMAADAAVAVATVVTVDKQTRKLTLKGPEGDELTFTAGPEVRNFDQIKRGDRVIVEYFARLAVALEPKGTDVRARLDTLEVERAKRGERPAGKITKTMGAVGMVQAINKTGQTITLKGPDRSVVLGVSNDLNLSRIKVGQEVEAIYVESFAVAVVPAPKVSGTVKIESKSVALGIGVEWGHGTLTMYDGSTHKFKIKGLSVLDLGISKVDASGEVFKLVQAKDLNGTFIAGEAGAALIGGGSVIAMKNGNGVVMQLKSTQKGVKLTLAGEGLKVSSVK